MEYHFTFDIASLNLIAKGLGELPGKEMMGLYTQMKAQVQLQDAEQAKDASDAPTDPPAPAVLTDDAA